MTKHLAGFLILIMIFTMAGCALMIKYPTQQQIETADYGAYPENYQSIATTYISNYLLDPESAKYSGWSLPQKSWYADLNQAYFGYKVCFYINAKNRMGGYNGKKLTLLLIRDGVVIYREGGNYEYGTIGETDIQNKCYK